MSDKDQADAVWLRGRLGFWGRCLLGVYALGLPILLILWTLRIWPLATAAAPGDFTILWWECKGITADQALMACVAILGGLGGALHAAGSFTVFAGNRRLNRSWVWWYLARAPIGASLVTSTGNGASTLNPHGLGAFAVLAGLSSEIATQKLREVFEVLFRPRDEKKDRLDARAPEITELSPDRAAAGSEALPISVVGAGFMEGDAVLIDGKPEQTDFVSENELTTTVPKAKLAATGELRIAVRRPQPRPIQSRELTFKVE
jgi:hypothetical protein